MPMPLGVGRRRAVRAFVVLNFARQADGIRSAEAGEVRRRLVSAARSLFMRRGMEIERLGGGGEAPRRPDPEAGADRSDLAPADRGGVQWRERRTLIHMARPRAFR